MASKFSAVGIQKLWYCDPLTTAPTAATLNATITAATEIDNVHQGTWSVEEAEASQDSYKNQLTGATYRMGEKTMGDITVAFTIGRYDFSTKAALMGGTAIGNSHDEGWSRQRGVVNIEKTIIALTEDDIYLVVPRCNLKVREGNSDGALGISFSGVILEPDDVSIAAEYWFDKSKVTTNAV